MKGVHGRAKQSVGIHLCCIPIPGLYAARAHYDDPDPEEDVGPKERLPALNVGKR